MSRFAAWEAHNTAKFARDCAKALSEQEELIKSLRADLKTAIRAYRHLVIEGAKNDSLPISTEQRFQVDQRG
jgi:dethiobiotin synthetase